jgi:signal recognition particle receptor subunit beta
VQLDDRSREVALKLVYDGPALSGKTANLRALHELVAEPHRARMIALDTRDDRTMFFDLLPLTVKVNGVALRIKLYTVPGQALHNATRRLVLQGVDGVAFIADSRVTAARSNAESFVNLKQNLRDAGRDIKSVPLVIQFNKRDLPEVRSDAELVALAKMGAEPVFRAVASRGEGVGETFVALLERVLQKLEREGALASAFSTDAASALAEITDALALPKASAAARIDGAPR